MERVDLKDPKYSHLHPLCVNSKGGLYIDKTTDKFIQGIFLHFEVVEWNLSTYKEFRAIWLQVQNTFLNKGINRLFATAPSEKEEKLIKMFGFTYSGLTLHGFKLMEKTLCHQQSPS